MNELFLKNYMNFTGKVFDEIMEKDNCSYFFSPLSVYTIMAVLERSAAGKSADEIGKLLRNEAYDKDKFLKDIKAFFANMNTNDNGFESANALAVNERYMKFIQENFVEFVKTEFGAEVFSDSNLVARINNWVCEKTDGMINNMMPEGTEVDFALINGVAFQAAWKDEYDEYDIVDDCFFFNANNKREKAVMLESVEQYVIIDEDFIGFTKPYKGNEFEFMAILPKEPGVGLKSLTNNGFMSRVRDIYNNRTKMKVFVTMPEFKMETECMLIPAFQKLGVNTVFTDEADMNPIIAIEGSHVQSIIHKSFIQVDRSGTKAAAVSEAVCVCGCASDFEEKILKVNLNRPFLFAIIHKKTGIPVFVGAVNSIG